MEGESVHIGAPDGRVGLTGMLKANLPQGLHVACRQWHSLVWGAASLCSASTPQPRVSEGSLLQSTTGIPGSTFWHRHASGGHAQFLLPHRSEKPRGGMWPQYAVVDSITAEAISIPPDKRKIRD